ncbi:hypothetical protein H2248_000193 [Termitomyces sp. 'cryptogamus']|nr:hypothetical protein H2248_000193 [Termitomyces sp. 'cryptogamus']
MKASVLNWPAYSVNCAGKTSNQFFPSGQALPKGIPSYAKKDPTTWPEERFDVSQAQAIVNQDNSTSSHSSHVGAIVGGVIGGFAVISLASGLAFYLYRKKQKRIQTSAGNDGSKPARKISESDLYRITVFGYDQQPERNYATTLSSGPPVSPTTGTMHTHTGSVNSFSCFGSLNHSVTPHATSIILPPPVEEQSISPATLPPSHQLNAKGLNCEEIIVPYTLPPPEMISHQGSNANLSDRKRADGAIIPVCSLRSPLPAHVVPVVDALGEISTFRARVNPPAYSVGHAASIAPSRRMYSEKGSDDTRFSIDSKTDGVTSVDQPNGGTGGASVSTIDGSIGQTSFLGQESLNNGETPSTGQSGQLLGVRLFRPVVSNPDP